MKLYQKIDLIEKLHDDFQLNQEELTYLRSLDLYDSIHIEGNTLTRKEVTDFLLHNITVRNKPLKEYLECKNYNTAHEFLKNNITNDFELTPLFIRTIHRFVSFDILEIEYCGNYRDDAVFLRTSSYIPPDAVEIPNLIVELCCYYNDFNIESQTRFENIIETYYRFEKIHPFFDGNGRTGRLLMNYLLILNGYSFLWINSELRSEYLASFEDNRLCLDFHADRMLEIYQALKQRRMEEKI